MHRIELPAGGSFTFDDISVEIPLLKLASEVTDILTDGGGIGEVLNIFNREGLEKVKNIDPSKLMKEMYYEIEIVAFGVNKIFRNSLM